MLHQPRTPLEKINHDRVLDSIPFDMAEAYEERFQALKGPRRGSKKGGCPLEKLTLRHRYDPVDDLVKTGLKACVELLHTKMFWESNFFVLKCVS